MNIEARQIHAMQARSPLAGQVVGAIRFPALLLIWSLGLVLLAGAYYPADALVRQPPMQFRELPQVPTLADPQALARGLEVELQRAQVSGGSWQPAAPVLVPAIEPVVDVVVDLPVSVPVPVPVLEPQLEIKAAPVVKQNKAQAPVAGFEKQSVSATRQAPQNVVVPVMGRTLLAKRQARQHLAAGRVQSAYALLMTEIAGGAQDLEYLGLFAVAAFASGRPAEALVVYERLQELEPDNERWSVGLGLCREKLGMDPLPAYEKAVALSQVDSAVHTIARDRLQELG
jgi:tetratricopeptide (TPR) repeat protein